MHILCKYQGTFRAKLRKQVLYGIFNIKPNHFVLNMKCSVDKLQYLKSTLYALDYEWLRQAYNNDTLSLMWGSALRPEGPDYWSRK